MYRGVSYNFSNFFAIHFFGNSNNIKNLKGGKGQNKGFQYVFTTNLVHLSLIFYREGSNITKTCRTIVSSINTDCLITLLNIKFYYLISTSVVLSRQTVIVFLYVLVRTPILVLSVKLVGCTGVSNKVDHKTWKSHLPCKTTKRSPCAPAMLEIGIDVVLDGF